MATEQEEIPKRLKTVREESQSPKQAQLSELEFDTLLVGLTVALGIVYLYLAMAMFHASYFLLLLDSPNERESFWVHTLAWVWRHGILVLVGSFLLGWDMSLRDNKRKGLIVLVGTFPVWTICVLLFTLFVDAVDLLVFHHDE
jgi:hypothetical protein